MKASKYKHRNINSKRRTRKIKGGSIGIGNLLSNNLCPGCRSDNTTAVGAYSLKTPLPDWPPSWNKGTMCGGGKRKGKGRRKVGGGGGGGGFTCGGCGQMCTKSPLQFLQSGGSKKSKTTRRQRKM